MMNVYFSSKDLCEFVENMMKTFLSMHRKHIFRNSIKLPMTSEAVKCLFESCKKLEDIGIPLMYILKDSLVRDIDDIINSSYNRLIYWIGSIFLAFSTPNMVLIFLKSNKKLQNNILYSFQLSGAGFLAKNSGEIPV